jgi:molybdate transport system permease protein
MQALRPSPVRDWQATMNFSEEEWTAIRLSLQVAALAVACSLPFGILVAWLLARGRFYGKALLSGIVASPLILPPVVTGYLLLMAFGRKGIFGGALESVGIVFSFRWTGAAIAAAVMGFLCSSRRSSSPWRRSTAGSNRRPARLAPVR